MYMDAVRFEFRSFARDSISRWDRYLGMTAAMTQVPVPTARAVDF